MRPGGSAGGHRGLNSTINFLGTQDFARLRIGIGRPPGERQADKDEAVIDHVLGDFTPEEEKALSAILSRATDAVACYLEDGIEAAMNRFN